MKKIDIFLVGFLAILIVITGLSFIFPDFGNDPESTTHIEVENTKKKYI